VEKPEGKRPLGGQDVGGWTVLKQILEVGWDDMGWINLAQNRDKCRALVNKVMNLRVQ
jgi:hypothetical protein